MFYEMFIQLSYNKANRHPNDIHTFLTFLDFPPCFSFALLWFDIKYKIVLFLIFKGVII